MQLSYLSYKCLQRCAANKKDGKLDWSNGPFYFNSDRVDKKIDNRLQKWIRIDNLLLIWQNTLDLLK